MSSKFPMSVNTLSGPSICEDEWNEDDLEDLDPDSSGGEFGVGQTVVMISCIGRSSTAVLHNYRQSETNTRWVKIVAGVGERGGCWRTAREARIVGCPGGYLSARARDAGRRMQAISENESKHRIK